jgi:hypothetical protein
MFEIGEKAVCIDDSPGSVPSTSCVEKGKIYVVRSFEAETALHWAVSQLVGIEGDWFVHRFRKLSDIQQENREKRRKKGLLGRVGPRGFSVE